MTKVTGARWNSTRSYYCVDFDDGITLFVTESYDVDGMIATGLDSYFLKNQSWPGHADLENRRQLSIKWLDRNKKRYKKSK